jgi:hypothetical protein
LIAQIGKRIPEIPACNGRYYQRLNTASSLLMQQRYVTFALYTYRDVPQLVLPENHQPNFEFIFVAFINIYTPILPSNIFTKEYALQFFSRVPIL